MVKICRKFGRTTKFADSLNIQRSLKLQRKTSHKIGCTPRFFREFVVVCMVACSTEVLATCTSRCFEAQVPGDDRGGWEGNPGQKEERHDRKETDCAWAVPSGAGHGRWTMVPAPASLFLSSSLLCSRHRALLLLGLHSLKTLTLPEKQQCKACKPLFVEDGSFGESEKSSTSPSAH